MTESSQSEPVRFVRSISLRLAIAFALVALVPLGIGLFVAWSSSQQALTTEVEARLGVLAEAKANRIEGYVGGLQREIAALAQSPDFLQIITADQPIIEEQLSVLIEKYSGSFDYSDLLVFFVGRLADWLCDGCPGEWPQPART